MSIAHACELVYYGISEDIRALEESVTLQVWATIVRFEPYSPPAVQSPMMRPFNGSMK